jgi:hypothetical protein
MSQQKGVTAGTVQMMIDYIQTKPYQEVAHIMDRLKSELSASEPRPDKTSDPAKPD